MRLAASHQALGDVGSLKRRTLGWWMGRQITGNCGGQILCSREAQPFGAAKQYGRRELQSGPLCSLIG